MDVQKGTWCFYIGCEFFGNGLDTKPYYNWLVWGIWNFMPIIDKKSTRYCNIVWPKKIIAYVKDERSNLYIMMTPFKYVIGCDILGVKDFF